MNITGLLEGCRLVTELFGIYLIWMAIFYGASRGHTYFCVPEGFVGFLMTPFLAQTPHCAAFRWLINNGALYINAFWMTLTGICIKKLAYG